MFTDNKIYICLSTHNASLTTVGGNNSLKKNRRIIYPTSDGYKLSGFLRDYDFDYESPSKKLDECEEKLKLNLIKDTSLSATECNVVFEKVKIPPAKNSSNKIGNKARKSYMQVTKNAKDIREGSILTSSTIVTDWGQHELCNFEEDDDDDIQWKKFLELRKHASEVNDQTMTL